MKRIFLSYGPAIGAGIALSWSFPTFHFHWLAWIALTPLFLRTAPCTPRVAALHFFICGHVFHTLLLQWLVANIFWAGGWAVIGQQLLCLILSLYWGLLGFVWAWGHGRAPRMAGAACLACLWVGMELLQARLFSGFGWSALGYSQGANLWGAQWASLGGVSLLSFFVVLTNALLALGVVEKEGRVKRLVCIPALLITIFAVGYLLLDKSDYDARPLQVGVIQPNFPQEMKWDAAYDFDMLERTADMTRSLAAHRPLDLVVWPEALIVRHFETPAFLEALTNTALDTQAHIFTGAVRNEYATGHSYNSSALVAPDGAFVGHYDKIRLAAFGEYIPFEDYLPFIGSIAFGGIAAGKAPLTFPVKERSLGPLICFEVLFAPMAERLRTMGADMLVVITNLGWFGSSNAIAQELEIARMRAIETRLPLIHSANTGISGVFDPYGRFTVVHYALAGRGELMDYGSDMNPRHVVARRYLGDFALAAPARRMLPYGPVLLPWLLALLGPVSVLAAGVAGLHLPVPLPEIEPPKKRKAAKKAGGAEKRSKK